MQVIVLGMHRSGTSLLSGLLGLSGVYFGEKNDFIPANVENPKGFWELKDIRRLNDSLLYGLGCDWNELSHLKDEKINPDILDSFISQAETVVKNLKESSPTGIIGLKEPRFCVLMEYWKNVLPSENFYILVHRDINEIAISLKNRNNIPSTVANYLTEQYLESTISTLQHENFHVVSFAQLMSDPQLELDKIISSIALATGHKLTKPNIKDINKFVTPSLYRSKVTGKKHQHNPRLEAWSQILENGKLPKISKDRVTPPASVLSYEHKNRFSEFLKLNTKFTNLEKNYWKVVDLQAENKELIESHYKRAIQLKDNIGTQKNKIEELTQNNGTQNLKINELSNNISTHKGKIQELTKKAEGQNIQIENLTDSVENHKQEALILSDNIDHQNDKVNELTSNIRAQTKKIQELHNTVEHLLEKAKIDKNIAARLTKEITKANEDKQNYIVILDGIVSTLELLISTKAWWIARKLIRLLLRPFQLGRGETVLHELYRSIDSYRILQQTELRLKESASEERFSTVLVKPQTSQQKLTPILLNEQPLPKNSSEHDYIEGKLIGAKQVQVSMIVLNRDGEAHLELFFSTFLTQHQSTNIEIIIADHGSEDNSIKIIKKYMEVLPIKLLKFSQNNSFAFSNNFSLRYAAGTILVFSNNDIIFEQPTILKLISELDDTEVGLVGLPLYYANDKNENSGNLQHSGISFAIDEQFDFPRPINKQSISDGGIKRNQAVVTAALVACRKEDFINSGGFNEGYNYGYEDVDLCLTFRCHLNKLVILSDKISAIHDESASQKKDNSETLSKRRRSNISLLRKRYGHFIEKQCFASKLIGGQWSEGSFRVGLVVTDDDPNTKAGDFFTASELAATLHSELGWQCSYLPKLSESKDWYDVNGLDCIIVLLDNYDISKIYNASTRIMKISWLRNWFDRWANRSWFNDYDLCLCSSEKSKEYISETTGRQAYILKIACNPVRFNTELTADDKYVSDYCFTGSYWGSPREIENFDPQDLEYNFALYGVGWEQHPQFSESHRGSLPYKELAKVYASTKILLDDANHVTKPWGSVNSRVFDALAAGVLVITNGDIGAKETFDNLLPTYNSVQELQEKIQYYLENPAERKALTQLLHDKVINEHTYANRARELREILQQESLTKTRVAIKLPVPRIEVMNEWGDYHLGKGLALSLQALGYSVRLDIIPDWYTKRALPDDVVITIRGLSAYKPDERHVNFMWQISHPDKVDDQEYEEYDHVFVASEKYAKELSTRLTTSVSILLQCSDPIRFAFDTQRKRNQDIIFVGNSRKQFRPIVKDAIEAHLDLFVYGTLWEDLIDEKYIIGQNIKNEELGAFYSTSGVILNDHWDTMKENGFISNRLFDAAACGAIIISDDVLGIDKIFDNLVYTYSNGSEELKECVVKALSEGSEKMKRREKLAHKIAKEHSFDARAKELSEKINDYLKVEKAALYVAGSLK